MPLCMLTRNSRQPLKHIRLYTHSSILPTHHSDLCCRCRARSPSPWTTQTTRRVRHQLAQHRAGSAAHCAAPPTGGLLMCSRCAAATQWRMASCAAGVAGPSHRVRSGALTDRLPGRHCGQRAAACLHGLQQHARCSASALLLACLDTETSSISVSRRRSCAGCRA